MALKRIIQYISRQYRKQSQETSVWRNSLYTYNSMMFPFIYIIYQKFFEGLLILFIRQPHDIAIKSFFCESTAPPYRGPWVIRQPPGRPCKIQIAAVYNNKEFRPILFIHLFQLYLLFSFFSRSKRQTITRHGIPISPRLLLQAQLQST